MNSIIRPLMIVVFVCGVALDAGAQDPLGKCQLVLVPSTERLNPLVVQSPDAKLLARIFLQRDSRSAQRAGVELFAARGDIRYTRIRRYNLPHTDLPTFAFLAHDGTLVTLGTQRLDKQIDVVNVFRGDGTLAYSVRGTDVMTPAQLEKSREVYEMSANCTPDDAWICWSDEPILRAGEVHLNDTLGAHVAINLATGKIRRTASGSKCGMFE